MVRLLFIAGTVSHGGGAEAVLLDLCSHLDTTKYSVSIFQVMNYHVQKTVFPPSVKILPAWLLDTKFPLRAFNFTNEHLLKYKPAVLSTLFNLGGHDVVIAWNGEKSPCLMVGVPSPRKVAWFHSSIEDLDATKFPAMKERAALVRNAYSKVLRIVTISNMSMRSLQQVFPEFTSKATIVHNMCNVPLVVQKSKEFAAGFSGKNVVAVGRLEARKNFALLLQAAAVLHNEGVDFTTHIIGSGKELDNLKSLAARLGVASSVVFHGFVPNPLPFIAASNCLCITSTNEGWPTVAAEAMALGVPFVTTPVAGSSEELAANGKCGIVASFDPADFAHQLKKILLDPALQKSMGNACSSHIATFSSQNTIAAFEGVVAPLCDAPPASNSALPASLALSIVLYLVYFSLNIARLAQCVSFIRMARVKKTLFGVKLPFAARLFCGGGVMLIMALIAPILALPRFLMALIYIAHILTKTRRKVAPIS